jgi:D-serine deaminase-like pyridoxal phosphate-dependent protein
MPRLVYDLPTPSLLVQRAILDANIAAMQARCEAAGLRLRPHAKTHRSPEIAQRQLEAGAVGLTVAKPAEAEAFAEAGVADIRVAYPVAGEDAHRRLIALAEAGTAISFCADTVAGARQASGYWKMSGRAARVLVEVDTGHRRTGVPVEGRELLRVVQAVRDAPGLEFVGLLTHGGQSYYGPEEGESEAEALIRCMEAERGGLLAAAGRLADAGLAEPGQIELSLGSTPTLHVFENRTENGFTITEARPGNYVFHDAQQVMLGSATLAQCALTVQATVVSRRRDDGGAERVYLDAGKKTLTTDLGYGIETYGILLHSAQTMKPLPHARLTALSEEHGWVEIPGGATFDVGDRVQLVPNHACVAVSTQERLYVVEGERVVEEWTVHQPAST